MNKDLHINKTIITIVVLNLSEIAVISGILFYLSGNSRNYGLFSDPALLALIAVVLGTIIFNTISAIRNRYSLKKSGEQFLVLMETYS
ncbi:MAG: hypothetical protein HGA22_05095, partial [Clostridiales bacterium]|nr:hypothetical protein [Clostridiales bacterium]